MNDDLQDRRIFATLQRSLAGERDRSRSPGERLLLVGRFFLGTPYTAGILENEGPEITVVNLRRFDCFTFVETVVALARLLPAGPASFEDFRAALTSIRYRRGRAEGYASRLHYFSDWLFDNQRKGVLKDISRSLDGQTFARKIHYMTAHSECYPPLSDRNVYRQMREIERRMQRRRTCYIPAASVGKNEGRIIDGDLIAVTSLTEGLDVTHCGIACHVKKRLHLLHASSLAGRVILSGETLVHYLTEKSDRSGIMVARVLAGPAPSL